MGNPVDRENSVSPVGPVADETLSVFEEYSCRIVNRCPVVVRRRVKWGECDPAGVVYTPRFADYVAEAQHLFLEVLLGGSIQERMVELDVGTPAKALSLVFKRSLWPDQIFEMTVLVTDIRNRSFDLQFRAADVEKGDIFVADLAVICVWHQKRESRSIPSVLRERLMHYRHQCASRT